MHHYDKTLKDTIDLMKKYLLLLCAALLIAGCASSKNRSNYSQLQNSQVVTSELQAQERLWRGTPYQLCGNSRSGIDCSAFVQRTLTERFAINVPRTTEDQMSTGRKIKRSQLKPGDLVFFKTNWGGTNLHVGIYSGHQQFVHASTSKGVITSSLDNPYWQKHFYQARRL